MKQHHIFFIILLASTALCSSKVARAPLLTFFCELDPPDLPFVSDKDTINALKALNATVSVAIKDLSVERANYIQLLNQNNITTTAWLVVNYTQGYWANMDNAADFVVLYKQFKLWTSNYKLQWRSVGFDLEMDINQLNELVNGDYVDFAEQVIDRFFYQSQLLKARSIYETLAAQIQADGYLMESYIIPVIYDEIMANSSLIELLTSIVSVPSIPLQIPMLYSSGLPLGLGFLASYGPGLQAVGLGSTGGGVVNASIATDYRDWSEFERDLLYSYQYLTPNMYIYSLQGCVGHGYLQQMVNMNWNKPLSATDLLKFDVQKKLVNDQRESLRGLLYAAYSPSSALQWIYEHKFDAFEHVLDLLLAFLYWRQGN